MDEDGCFEIDCPREWYLPHHPVFQASTNVLDEMKRNEFNSDLVPSDPEKQEATAITAIVANKASTFVWQTYSSWRICCGPCPSLLVTGPKLVYYPLARIVKLNFGSDAITRSAEDRTVS